MATQMFDRIAENGKDVLEQEFKYKDDDIKRDRVIVRLAALLHDIGHCPFSHATEESEIFPQKPNSEKKYGHDDYRGKIIELYFSDIIKGHPQNRDFGIEAKEVVDFLNRSPNISRKLIWMDLISSQIDADRCDYLLRDSHHLGVNYGVYDLNRIIATLTLRMDNDGEPEIMIEKGGWHAIEGMVIARYMMFTQVYYHKTRVACDLHLVGILKRLLKEENKQGVFPAPENKKDIESYLNWDDWKVVGMMREGHGGEDSKAILTREHMRCIHETSEHRKPEEWKLTESINWELEKKGIQSNIDSSFKSWYNFNKEDILIYDEDDMSDNKIDTLQDQKYSSVVRGLVPLEQFRIYVRLEDRYKALEVRKKFLGVE